MPTLAVFLSDEILGVLINMAEKEEKQRIETGSSGKPVTAAAIGARLIRERLKEMEAKE